MKKIILTMITSLFCINIYSQRTCGSELNMEQIRRTEPLKYQRIMNWENQIKLHSRSVPSSTILIPVVVHVVYNNSAQNISDAQIISQIQVLNEDFRRMNADQANTPSAFANLAGNANIEFKLARRDPNGNTTNGITRTSTSTETFSMEMDNVKFSNLGGNNAWNTRRYLNIWVCKLDDDLLGYAQFPFEFQTKPNTDGVVISYRCFGRDGSAVSPFHKGRTTTHEVGHWLNLYHIWGDDDIPDEECVSDECSGTDHVADTPNQGERSLDCPSFPKTDCCTTTSPGVMFMNYMDYTDDACMNLFTKGQVERMRSLFDTQTGIRREMQIYANLLTTPLSISGPTSVCNQATYTIENLPVGVTVQWSVSNSNIATINSSSGVLTCRGNGICEVQATINNSSVVLTPLKICLGTPISQDITLTVESLNSNGTLCTDNPNAIMADHPGGNRLGYIREYEWRISNGWQIAHHPGDNGIYADNFIVTVIPLSPLPGSPTVSVRARSECGWGTWKEVQIPAVSCSRTISPFTLSPNPATDAVTLQLMETDEVSGLSVLSTERSPYEIQLWSGMTMLRSFRTNEPTFQIPMAGLPAGLYFVRVVKDGQTYTQKLIKK